LDTSSTSPVGLPHASPDPIGLQEKVLQAFSRDGALAETVEGYSPRTGQVTMARVVSETMENGGVLVVEAGTGVGKTYAYMVPALLSGGKVLVSTATKALQDQLYSRDVPALLNTLGISCRVALLKGRSSYLCLQRLAVARLGGSLQSAGSLRLLSSVEQWAQATRTGDLSEVPAVEESVQVMPLVTSTRENCTVSQCPKFQDCFLYKARREAMAADVVVINHHLFFADANVRESGVAELLPTVNTVVFDEAHQLNDVGVQFLGRQWSTGQMLALGRDLVAAGLQWARGLADWQTLVEQMESAVVDLQAVFQESGHAAPRVQWQYAVPVGVSSDVWLRRLARLKTVFDALQDALSQVSEVHPELQALAERSAFFSTQIAKAGHPVEGDWIRWIDNGARLRFVESPLDISEAMQAKVAPSLALDSRVSWIFTSATLAQGSDMQWFLDTTGLQGARTLRVESPFDYAAQAAIYVPRSFPLPSSAEHSSHVAQLVADSAQVLGGRTLVLTTTLRAMRLIGQSVRSLLPEHLDMQVLVQGEGSKRDLLARFQQPGHGGCVMVASATFWEGVDLPGESLQLLVIDKIPFAPPDDPLVQAHCARAEAAGRSAFADVQLPMAAIALQQGVGRLIRRETDEGVLVICDPRLTRMGYGRQLMATLPPMRLLQNKEQYLQALCGLTRLSTMGRY